MSTARYLLVAFAVIGAATAVVGLSPIIIMVAVLLWAWRRWRRAKVVPTDMPVVLPLEPVCHTWGYVVPLRAVPAEWVPGYVGLTRRAPTELPDGRLWCDRWKDKDHQDMAHIIDHDRAYVLYVADTWGKARVWEDATIDQYLELGAPLLNEQGNPHR